MTPEDTHDTLVRRHHQCEDALWTLPAQGKVGTPMWESMANAEREHREERVNRVLLRERTHHRL